MGVCTSRQSNIVHTTITVQPYSHNDASGQNQKSWATTNKRTSPNSKEDSSLQSTPNVRSSRYSPSPAHHPLKESSTKQQTSVPKGKQLQSLHKSLSVVIFSEQGPTAVPKSSVVGTTQQRSQHYYHLRKSLIDPKNRTLQQAISVSQFPLQFLPEDENQSECLRKEKPQVKAVRQNSSRPRNPSVVSEANSYRSQSTSSEYLSDEEECCMIDEMNVGQTMEDGTEVECKKTISKIIPKGDEITFRDEVQALLSSWEESGQLSAIRLHAHTATAEDRTDTVTLAQYLTMESSKYMKNLEDSPPHHVQLAKAYALFTWVCINISFNEEVGVQKTSTSADVDEALRNRLCSAFGCANLYAALANAAGLDSEVINGDASQFNTSQTALGSERAGSTNCHSWNAVSLLVHIHNTMHLYTCIG